MYALVLNDTITQVGTLPRLYHDGTRWWDYRHGQHDPAEQGWMEVQPTPRPADTATTTHDWGVELVAGVPVEVWTERDKTPDELAAEAEQQVELTLTEQVATEVQTIRDAIGPGDAPGGTDSLNALINQTNAVINASPAATIKPALRIVRSIARAAIRIARVVVRDYNTPASD